jgi:hypothetical protein
LDGEPNSTYDTLCTIPQPGDVVVIDRLRVVHSVIGCVLDEFANDSTDLVDRLFDQNRGRSIPKVFTREFSESRIRNMPTPSEHNLLNLSCGGARRTRIAPLKVPGGSKVEFGNIGVMAATYLFETSGNSDLISSGDFALTLHVRSGNGEVSIGERAEFRIGSPPPLRVSAGDVLLLPRETHYEVHNQSAGIMEVIEHRLPWEWAFR